MTLDFTLFCTGKIVTANGSRKAGIFCRLSQLVRCLIIHTDIYTDSLANLLLRDFGGKSGV